MSAIAFWCARFHDNVHGQQLTVETDHKPLLGLFQKTTEQVEPKAAMYEIEVAQVRPECYLETREGMFIPDALSRAVSENALIQNQQQVC